MKVSVYKGEKGVHTLLFEASLGRGLAPVLLRDVKPEELKMRVQEELDRLVRAPVLR